MSAPPADPAVLTHCVAIVVAHNAADGAALMRLAERLRFGETIAYAARLPQQAFYHRLVFFLVHFDFGDAARAELLAKLRHSGTVSLAYAPVVLFLREAPPEQVAACVRQGFDDVINVPAEGAQIAARLAAQIGREQLYIETRTYLGPDRHRMDGPRQRQQNADEAEPHARLTILRTVDEGVHIVHRERVPKPR